MVFINTFMSLETALHCVALHCVHCTAPNLTALHQSGYRCCYFKPNISQQMVRNILSIEMVLYL